MTESNRETVVVESAPKMRHDDFAGVVIGVLVGLGEDNHPLVAFPGNPESVAVRARTTATLCSEDVGREVALMFEQADPRRPLVIGPIQKPGARRVGDASSATARSAAIDGQRLVFSATSEIVLRCGDASITLTRAGKIIIRGAYLSSRSSGVNLIKGGSVQIN